MTSGLGDQSYQVTVVLPTYNELGSLPRVVKEIHHALAQIPHEVLVVDDNSPDGTWRWVEEEHREDSLLRLIRRTEKPGLSASVLEGFRHAGADRWIVMDADGQHDPALLPLMCERLAVHELVVGSRYAEGGSTGRWTLSRWLGSRGATWLARLILNVSLSDPMSGYFGIQRRAFASIQDEVNPRGFKILLELYYRMSRRKGKARVDFLELPFEFQPRIAGQSKLTGRIVWQYLCMLISLRKERIVPCKG